MATLFSTQKRRAEQKLWSKLDQHLAALVPHGVVLAISGGPDSRALLESVAHWPQRPRGKFIVAAIDHRVRREAKEESRFIVLRAQRLGFGTYSESLLDINLNDEHNLRIHRYQALKKAAELYSCHVICTAHHRDDNSEGYLMALMGVGGGELGAAMGELEQGEDIALCRPFLSLTKKDLLLSLSLRGATDFVRDRLDEKRVNRRAYVRHEVFPELSKLAPGIERRLSILGQAQRRQRLTIDKLAASLIVWHDNHAILTLKSCPDQALIIAALWQILKKWNKSSDLRSLNPTIENIASNLGMTPYDKSLGAGGLDPRLKGFSFKHLDRKVYHLPGVVVIRGPGGIMVSRV
jgi:tRNA(Ile)-lysidine synthetase-like protein